MSDSGPGYQRILVPVDFSPAAAHSLAYALALGDPFAATVDALHVWRTNTQTPVNVARERARAELRSFVTGIGPHGEAKLRRCTDYGDPYLTILRIAQLSSYDLLVSAAPRAGQSEHLGVELWQASRLPVLLVPPVWVETRQAPDLKRHLRRILLPAVFAGRAPVLVTRSLELAEALTATIDLVFVHDSAVEAEQAHCERELEQNPKLRERTERREIHEGLEPALATLAKEGGYDLMLLAGRRGEMTGRSADPLLGRLLLAQRCPTLCERFDDTEDRARS